MDDINTLLDQDDILSCVHQYELLRGNDRCFIHVYEVLSSTKKSKFIACPSLIIKECSDAFIGNGDTKEEALKECLSKIKGVSIESIFPDE